MDGDGQKKQGAQARRPARIYGPFRLSRAG